MSVTELRDLIADKDDDETVDLFVPGEAPGPMVNVLPGVRGRVVLREDGETQVRVRVGRLRHVLRLASTGERR